MTFTLEMAMCNVREFQQYFGYWIESIYHLSGHVDVTGKDVARACFLAHDPRVLMRKKYFSPAKQLVEILNDRREEGLTVEDKTAVGLIVAEKLHLV